MNNDFKDGEISERAIAIIDRLRADGHINNQEQGTLRRALLLPKIKHDTCLYTENDIVKWLGGVDNG